MSGLPLCAFILGFGRIRISWVSCDQCEIHVKAPWQFPEGRNRSESDTTNNSAPLKQPLYPIERGSPGVFSRSYHRNKFTGNVAACTMPTKYSSATVQSSGGYAAACPSWNLQQKGRLKELGKVLDQTLMTGFAGHTWLIKQFVWPARWSGDVGITGCPFHRLAS